MREKYPFTGHFGNTHAVIPTPEWGGGGGGGRGYGEGKTGKSIKKEKRIDQRKNKEIHDDRKEDRFKLADWPSNQLGPLQS